ncbi:MAG TPA: MFS transporter [Aggregatilinea sp.]|uniref:MFS transporter n=1 Tax=Aggregatilinea sp. TaxID=2806333 RepID=UPI002CFA4E58|nr:MFS transporter [Aggregatilinea sp.]HML21548.1 MFS transporter [Aggregatilinea sp.]
MENHARSTPGALRGPARNTFIFVILTMFLNAVGFGLLNPVAPFLVSDYVKNPADRGVMVGWMISIYAICQFLAAPGLGALSDRVGRRAILLVCLAGSAVGYLITGIGGALWVLFLGRVIDGLTGGNVGVVYATVADVTPPHDRSKYFGWLGAAGGIGFIMGPAIGGFASGLGHAAPLYVAAALTLVNLLLGVFFMPETLPPEKRVQQVRLAQLNPFGVLSKVFAIPQLRWLLAAWFLYNLPFAALQANLGLYAIDTLGWDSTGTSSIYVLVGLVNITTQGVLLGRLYRRFGDKRLMMGGMLLQVVGYTVIASVLVAKTSVVLYLGILFFSSGNGLIIPSMNGLFSRAATAQSQGRVQGGGQSVQSLARIVGPLMGGESYDRFGHAAPYLSGVGLVLVSLATVVTTLPAMEPERAPAAAD